MMKRKIIKTNLILNFLLYFLIFISCNNNKEQNKDIKQTESIDEGKLIVYIDSSIKKVIEPTLELYRNSYPKIEIIPNFVNARRAVALMFAGEAEVIILARNYLRDEDSLNKEFNLNRPEMIAAKDGIVFFTNPDFPLDTLNDIQIKEIFGEGKNLTDYYKNLKTEPYFVTTYRNSSINSNIELIVLNGKQIKKNLKVFGSTEEVLNYVKTNKYSIGIDYLSNLVNNIDFKLLRVSFINKYGERIPPQIVHQGFIVQEKYPYVNDIRLILREDRRNKPFWFASFLAKEAKVQKYFLDAGIVPGYAKIVLKPQESEIK